MRVLLRLFYYFMAPFQSGSYAFGGFGEVSIGAGGKYRTGGNGLSNAELDQSYERIPRCRCDCDCIGCRCPYSHLSFPESPDDGSPGQSGYVSGYVFPGTASTGPSSYSSNSTSRPSTSYANHDERAHRAMPGDHLVQRSRGHGISANLAAARQRHTTRYATSQSQNPFGRDERSPFDDSDDEANDNPPEDLLVETSSSMNISLSGTVHNGSDLTASEASSSGTGRGLSQSQQLVGVGYVFQGDGGLRRPTGFLQLSPGRGYGLPAQH